jgi:hypothetical protein
MPRVIFFTCLDLEQKSSFKDGHYLKSWFILDSAFLSHICDLYSIKQVSISNKKGLLRVCSPKNQKGCGLNARSPELFFGESGYPLPFRTTGCPAAAAAAALIARCALKVL